MDKSVTLYFWKDAVLKKEDVFLVWLSSKAEILQQLVGNWLTLVYEERILEKRVGVESVALSSSEQEMYLSFDQLPFVPKWSINKKIKLINGLQKTIDDAGLGIQKVVFLVRHEPMIDEHLDFSQPWRL